MAVVRQRFDNPRETLGDRLREGSIYRLLADQGGVLLADGCFADLYEASVRGRPSVPARVAATVMLLRAFEGLSDREATDRLEVDLRWQAAAVVDTGCEAFHPTVLVGMRNRLRASTPRPRRLFEDTKVVARQAGVLRDRARVLDSTPLLDAVQGVGEFGRSLDDPCILILAGHVVDPPSDNVTHGEVGTPRAAGEPTTGAASRDDRGGSTSPGPPRG